MKNIINKFLPLLLVAIIVSACSKTTTIRHHKDFQTHLHKSKSLTILPAEVEVVTMGLTEKKTRNYNYEALVEDLIVEQLREKLSQKGYKTKSLSKREIHNKKLSRNVLGFREGYNKTIAELYKIALWEKEKASNIETFLEKKSKEISEFSGSNLVVFVEYHLKVRGSSARTKDIAIALLAAYAGNQVAQEPDELMSVRIAIVNPSNGQFIWSNYGSIPYGFFSNMFVKEARSIEIKRLNEIFDILLKTLPTRDKLNSDLNS